MTPEQIKSIHTLFREYGSASIPEIAKAVDCNSLQVASIVGSEAAALRSLAVFAKRGREIDEFIVSCMVRRLGGRRVAA